MKPIKPILFAATGLATAALAPLSAQDASRPSIDQLQSVIPTIGPNEAPVWSVDGANLLYIGGGDGGLWTVSATGGTPIRLADALGGATQLRRSPDGRMVTYVKNVAGGNDIFGWDLAAKSERRITTLSGHVRSYSWSPDGRSIALANDRNGSEDIWVVTAADGAAKRLTSSPLRRSTWVWTATSGRCCSFTPAVDLTSIRPKPRSRRSRMSTDTKTPSARKAAS